MNRGVVKKTKGHTDYFVLMLSTVNNWQNQVVHRSKTRNLLRQTKAARAHTNLTISYQCTLHSPILITRSHVLNQTSLIFEMLNKCVNNLIVNVSLFSAVQTLKKWSSMKQWSAQAQVPVEQFILSDMCSQRGEFLLLHLLTVVCRHQQLSLNIVLMISLLQLVQHSKNKQKTTT